VTQQGFASEKERQVQLAHAQQESAREDPAFVPAAASAESSDEGYAMVAVGALALAAGTAMAGAVFGRSTGSGMAWALEPARASAHRRARRRGRR
jgi:predicted phage tail protein